MGPQGIDVVEGLAQVAIVFIGQADDEVEVKVHRIEGYEAFHDVRDPRPVVVTADGLQGRFIRRLNAHFQLDASLGGLGQ